MNIYQKINRIMGEVSYIQKEQKQGMRYSIVSHDAVTALLRKPMQEVGIVYFPVDIQSEQVGNRTQIKMVVKFVNMDESGEYILVESIGYGIDEQDKGPGKAMSYAMKYALLKTFGLETGDDPDNDQSAKFVPAPQFRVATIDVQSIDGSYVTTESGKKIKASDKAMLSMVGPGEYKVKLIMGDKPEIIEVVKQGTP